MCTRIEENLQSCTDFIFVNANLDAIKKIQQQSEKADYNEQESIEVGKISVAKYAVFVTIRKSETYTVSAEVTDLTTGRKYATASSSERPNINDLWSKSGCAADEVTLKLCEKLGITLTSAQKNLLLPVKENLSANSGKANSENKKEVSANKEYWQFSLKPWHDTIFLEILNLPLV